jgi:hypothetical protein
VGERARLRLRVRPPRRADAPERRQADRREQPIVLPAGIERRGLKRRASDVPKTPCPFCGGSSSSVYKSKPALSRDVYRRRRECAECVDEAGRPSTWATVEYTDWGLFEAELKLRGQTLADVGYAWPDRTKPPVRAA